MDLQLIEYHNRMLSSVTGLSFHQMRRNVRMEARKMSSISKVAYMRYHELVYNKNVFSD